MRIPLDECGDESLRHLFGAHECQSARYAGLAGLKNGALLLAAEGAGFEVIVTTDQEIPHQKNLRQRRISIVILCGPTNRLTDLKPLVPAALRAIDAIGHGQVIAIHSEG